MRGNLEPRQQQLAFYDLKSKTTDPDYFTTVNKRGLGDTANDMIKYGSKIYIVVNESGTIEVIDAATGKSLKQIEMKEKTAEGKEITAAPLLLLTGGKYMSLSRQYRNPHRYRFAGNRRLSDGWTRSGGYLHQNGKIYVANSGGLISELRQDGFGDRSKKLKK